MRRLRGSDAVFLSMETSAWHQHVGGLTVLEPGDRPVTFEEVVERIDGRLDWAPKFRWKIREVPLGLDRPMWVDDADFDVRQHIHRIGVPSPGGAREVAEVTGDLLSTQLDRSRPLWEMWFMEGLAGGRIALLMKYHHCLLDGMAGASLATVLLDLDVDASEPMAPAPPPEEQSAGADPSNVELVGRVLGEAAQRPIRAARYLAAGAERMVAGVRMARADEWNRAPLRAPQLSFNAPIGPRRAAAFASVSLEDVRRLKTEHDVKVNDVVLAIVAGALRGHLLDLDLLPDGSLVAAVPVSLRKEGDDSQDNKVSSRFVALSTDIEDPVERLQAVHDAANSAKAMHQAMGVREIQSLGEVASPLILSTAIRALYRSQLASRAPVRVNVVVSNVPGPPIDLYCCGAKIKGIYSCSVLMETQGLNITLLSYGDRLDFGLHVDPELIPDPWVIAERLPAAAAELLEASGLGKPTPVDDPFGP